ncbi:glycosyltransferase family 4 protein [Lactobacillus taiwanensis]|uniref:glycosyltransferase family 4 protein n=1 Tax=Lactobacillus taiwanensis TaxID=508451 RepID=UPI00242E27B7|nr:glycosyltransferase family 4 protein [Lactobacillus taiwanensis]
MKKIYFVLPGFSRRPIGGYKIILKYANLLASENYEVRIVYLEGNRYPKYSWKWLILNYWTKKGPDWIKLNSSIKTYTIKDLKKAMIETNSEDIAIASSVETVSPTETLFSNAKKFYFIQDLEDWNVDKEYLFETYNKDFTNITISRWLKEVVDKHTSDSKKTEYIRNPIDTTAYRVFKPVEKRNPFKIGMLYHKAPYKGSKQTLKAILGLKKRYPQLELIMFGTAEAPKKLPEWITYHKNATQTETIAIYNSISIFVSGTIKEGFGLTGLEAMACGAALVSTDYLGAKEYAINNVNSLLSPVHDYGALQKNVELLMKDDTLRVSLAKHGVQRAQEYSWNRAYDKFKKVIFKSK